MRRGKMKFLKTESCDSRICSNCRWCPITEHVLSTYSVHGRADDSLERSFGAGGSYVRRVRYGRRERQPVRQTVEHFDRQRPERVSDVRVRGERQEERKEHQREHGRVADAFQCVTCKHMGTYDKRQFSC